MEKARKIKATDQKKLNHAKKRGLNLDNLINLYGLKFVLKLLTSLIKPQLTGPNTTFPVYPSWRFSYQKESDRDRYFDNLEKAGFKLKKCYEDFIDEDTGEIVSIERNKIYYIGRIKVSKKTKKRKL